MSVTTGSAAALVARAMAGKKQAASDDRDAVVTFRVTPTEKAVLELAARQESRTLSAFVREAGLEVARALLSDVDDEELQRRYSERESEQLTKERQALEALRGKR
ncbi:DUF1778 domain-containing protein [Kineosporia sp. R_H_3]|uniref:plasmid mobilization protein n=1 Tax=Kineosporia sp. R_H_3 TaxID=1961848 RepID=UPI0013046F97|nr:DUF1778 domain-containing protein [Kineosporia sp. R_H_3]